MDWKKRNPTVPPTDLSDYMFLCLIACFADPKRAEILRAVIFDNQQEALQEVILAILTRGQDGEPEANR